MVARVTVSPRNKPEYNYALCTWSTPKNGAIQDIEQCAAAGIEACGLWEAKFKPGEDGKIEETLAKHGVKAGIVMAHHWTIMPTPLDPSGLKLDWKTKAEALCKSVDRMARFKPVAMMIGGGASGDPNNRLQGVPDLVEGIKMIADAAAKHDMICAFEPLAMRRGSIVSTIPESLDLLDKVRRPNVKILLDVWHCWPEPGLLKNIKGDILQHLMGIQVNDVRNPERSWCDRMMPGDGRNVCTPIVATLIEAGWNGWYDFEVFSDDGRWGNKFPDSLWALPSEEFVNRAATSFAKVYADAKQMVAAGTVPKELPVD